MVPWETALQKFLDDWKTNRPVTGAMVCGSFVTGNPSPMSDVDVHILLPDDIDWRERGNKYIDGIQIEYFSNPARQIEKYFADDYRSRETQAAVQFATGRILFDDAGGIAALKTKADEWLAKPFPPFTREQLERAKYFTWSSLDKLKSQYELYSPQFDLSYHCALAATYHQYASFLGMPGSSYIQIYSHLFSPDAAVKYLRRPFPDTVFGDLFRQCLRADGEATITSYEMLVAHVLDRMGGFTIDGWEFRTPLDVV